MNAAAPAPDTRPAPTPPTACPHCRGELAGRIRLHCSKADRRTPCGWVKCQCKATIDLRTGRHDHPTHHGVATHAWPCSTHRSAP